MATRLLQTLAVLGEIVTAGGLYIILAGPRLLGWGANDEERRRPLSGDDLVRDD